MSSARRPDESRWRRFVDSARREDRPFEDHLRAIEETFGPLDLEGAPPPVWRPDERAARESNLASAMRELGLDSYEAFHAWSVADRPRFWRYVLDRLRIVVAEGGETIAARPDDVRHPGWLAGARMNCVDSCFGAPADRAAIVAADERSGTPRVLTYGDLKRRVDRVAAGLRRHGYGPGRRIALYMPMNADCVAAYLGILRAGCQAVSIADSFPPEEIARRLRIADADTVVTVRRFVRGGKTIEPLRNVIAAGARHAIVVDDQTDGGLTVGVEALTWTKLLSGTDSIEPFATEPETTTTVLFSSGTTGDPKAIPWTHLTPIKCAMDGHFHQDIRESDVVAWPTNIGWMMGPWLIFATLVNRATMALYEGTPTSNGFLEFVERAGVTVLGLVPSIVRAWRRPEIDPRRLAGVRLFSSTGEPSSFEDYLWLMGRTGYRAPVIEYCGGTEIGGGYVTGSVLQPASPSVFTTPALGLDLVRIDDSGSPVRGEGAGEVFLVPPSIGLSERLLNRDHDATYYDDCPVGPDGQTLRRHGDRLVRLPGGGYRSQGRSDDTMNLSGIKVGSLEIEQVLEQHPSVGEAAAVGVQLGGQGGERLIVFVRTTAEASPADLASELRTLLATKLNPLFRLHDLVVVDDLPRTASNKLMRRELRARYLTHRDRG